MFASISTMYAVKQLGTGARDRQRQVAPTCQRHDALLPPFRFLLLACAPVPDLAVPLLCPTAQLLFFGALDLLPWVGFYWMGVVVLVASAAAWGIYFPQWGGMCCRPRAGASEEVYYLGEFSAPERAAGAHYGSLAFAFEARANRALPPPSPGLFAPDAASRAAGGRV